MYQLILYEIFKEASMDWSEFSKRVLESSEIPDEIKNTPNRLDDFLLGSKTTYELLGSIFGDDLK